MAASSAIYTRTHTHIYTHAYMLRAANSYTNTHAHTHIHCTTTTKKAAAAPTTTTTTTITTTAAIIIIRCARSPRPTPTLYTSRRSVAACNIYYYTLSRARRRLPLTLSLSRCLIPSLSLNAARPTSAATPRAYEREIFYIAAAEATELPLRKGSAVPRRGRRRDVSPYTV